MEVNMKFPLNIGIRLHDTVPGTLAERVNSARSQGFSCAHLALSKALGAEFIQPERLTPGLAAYVRKSMGDMDITVLGCYLNPTHPDEAVYRDIFDKYVAHLRFSRFVNAGMVGTETGNPNAEYAYDPTLSHTERALDFFIERFEPIVRAAEKLGAIIAIEPVYKHIVWCPSAARRVLDEIASPNLGIIFDPVNLLHADNIHRRDALMDAALELLGKEILTIHLKDFVVDASGQPVHSVIGKGEMEYTQLFRYVKANKPCIGMTLEDTTPEDAPGALAYLSECYEKA